MRIVYSWNAANIDHIAKHGVDEGEAEYVVYHPGRGYPRKHGEGKWLTWGRTDDGRYLQVIHIFPKEDEIDPDSLSLVDLIDFSEGRAKVVYVIHAMDLPDAGKRNFKKQR